MSLKISQLTLATSIGATDEFVINQAGTNKRIFREAIMDGGGGVDIGWSSGNGFVGIDTNDDAIIEADATKSIFFKLGGVLVGGFDPTGFSVLMPFTLDGTGAAIGDGIIMDAAGDIFIVAPAGQSIFVGYTPATSTDWAGDPDDVWEAIDRIAAVLGNGGATPIP